MARELDNLFSRFFSENNKKPLTFLGFLLFAVLSLQAQNSQLWKGEIETCKNLVDSDVQLAHKKIDSLIELLNASNSSDSSTYSDLITLKANANFNSGNFEEALRLNLEALKIRLKLNDSYHVSSSYNNIGNIYYYTYASEKAIEYLRMSLQLAAANKDTLRVANNFNTIGLVFLDMEELDSAEFYLNKSYRLSHKIKNEDASSLSDVLGNLAYVYILKDQEQEAIRYLNDAIEINKKNNNLSGLSWEYARLTEIYLELDSLEKAKHFLLLSDSISKFSSTLESKKNIINNYFSILHIINR